MSITIVTRAGKGAPLNATEHDANLENLAKAIENTSTGHDHDGSDSKKISAANVVNTPAGGIAATDVQAALNELDTEKAPKASPTITGHPTIEGATLTGVTGSGKMVLDTSPTLITPALGTPASGDLQNCTAATTSTKGVTVYAGNTKALAGTDTASAMTPADVAAAQAVLAREPDQGVAMTAAGSGSSGIAVADNDNLNMGTGNFAPYFCGIIPDVTPAANIILAQKHDGTNGWILTLLTTGYLRTTINAATYDSTATLASVGVVDGASVKILSGITRETDSVAGSVQHYVNGRALGTSVAITAGAPTTVTNAVSLYVLGTSAVRTKGVANTFALFNRCPTAAEVLDLYRNGIAESDKWGSQTPVYTSDFSAGVDGWIAASGGAVAGNVDTIGGENDWLSFTVNTASGVHCSEKTALTAGKKYRYTLKYFIPSTNSNMTYATLWNSTGAVLSTLNVQDAATTVTGEFTALGTVVRVYGNGGISFQDAGGNDVFYVKEVVFTELGATLALEPSGIQPAPGQWLDSSSNKLHAMQPATGSSLTRYKKDFEYRWTNTWTASSAAQYIGGLNQAVLSADHFITDIITQATKTTDVKNLTLGDGSDADRFVTAFAPSATRTKQTVAAQNDGTNLKLVYTPAAAATMTVETIIRGFIWEP